MGTAAGGGQAPPAAAAAGIPGERTLEPRRVGMHCYRRGVSRPRRARQVARDCAK